MQAFAELLDRLVLTPSRNGKLRLIVSYFRSAPDPDRGYALGALTGDLDLKSIKPAQTSLYTNIYFTNNELITIIVAT